MINMTDAERQAWESLAREPCPSCGGNKTNRCRARGDGDCSWEHCPQMKDYKSGCPLADWENDEENTEPQMCPDCQEDGKSTGLWAWELTEPCDCRTWAGQHPANCPWCDGTERILLSGPSLLYAAEAVLGRHGAYVHSVLACGLHHYQPFGVENPPASMDVYEAVREAVEALYEQA